MKIAKANEPNADATVVHDHKLQYPIVFGKPVVGKGFNKGIKKVNKGLKKVFKRQINFTGKGYNKSKTNYAQLNKFMVNLDQLNNDSVLNLKYVSTRQPHARIRKQSVSEAVKDVILSFIKTDELDRKAFDLLNAKEKTFLYEFFSACHIDVDITSADHAEYKKQYDILLGEFENGNNNPAIRNKLKIYVNDFVSQKMISLKEGLIMLESLK